MPAEPVIQISGPWSHRSVTANGRRFHVASMGDGPLVLLLHGVGAHEGDLIVNLPNGSRIRLYGADNAEAMRGTYFDFVVIDEVAGQWIALLACPRDWPHALIALILFRLFDITKPFPARQLERLPEGWGIVFDDVAAGLYAFGIAALIRIWY